MTYSHNAPTPDHISAQTARPFPELPARPDLRLSFAQLKASPPAELRVPRSGAEDALETSVMRAHLRLMAALMWELLGVRGAATLAAGLRSALRQIYTEEKQAVTLWAKQLLRRSPDWQARVLEDLGGQAGISRWQARLRKSYETPPEDDYAWLDDDPENWPIQDETPPTASARKPRKGGTRFQTDRDGLFRWARIKLGRGARANSKRYSPGWNDPERPYEDSWNAPDIASDERPARHVFPDLGPIDLLPSDLMPPDDIYAALEEDGAAFEDGPDPLTLWAAMQAEHRYWHAKIMEFLERNRQHRAGLLLVPP